MKKLVLSFCIFGSLSAVAQNGLLAKISGGKVMTEQFTKLQAADQVSFNPANAKGSLGLQANADLRLLNAETDQLGQTHYRYLQTYQNIPVENSMLIAHTSAGKLEAISGAVITQFDSKMTQRSAASVSPSGAISKALSFVHATKYAWQDADVEARIKFRKGNTATYYPVATKVWYGGDDKIDPSALRLAYKVDIYSVQPLGRKFIYVDAQNGRVLGFKDEIESTDATGTAATGYSGTQTIHSDLSGSTYRLRDLTKGNGIITLHAATGHADYTSATANWSFTTADKWALDAHYGASSTWTFYKNNFNRNSVDNAGYALTSWVNDAATTDNAYWDGSEMVYGNRSSNGAGVVGIDVTGHELTHGVTQNTCNLTYSKEPGAMNESMSDIMGKSVQFYTKPADNSWILSNDMAWEIRSFSNPKADGQPNTYLGTNWVTSSTDNYGVHTNSGVGNYMFYLLVTGGSGTNDIGNAYTVSGIGLTEADQILYRTETVYLTATSQYADWRTACINAATDLYGATSNEVTQVKNAWYAVGIGTAGGTGGTCTAPTGLAVSAITNTGATASWAAVTGASGYTLQYKLASAGTFTTVSGITGTSYNLTGLTAGSAYQVQVSSTCTGGGSSAYSAVVSFTTTGTAPVTYCTSVGQTVDGITNVTFNTINNTTSGTTAGYTDYTASQSTTVNTGSAYTLSVKINTGGNYTNYAKAWIDWNHDGVFSTTTEEYNLGTAVNTASGLTTLSPLSITVPAGATIGTTRMRVTTQYNAAPSPCTASFDGEVEDYSIVVAAGSGGTCNAPTGLAASAITTTSATLGWTAVSGATGYSVQYKLSSASTWTTVTSATNSYALSGLTAGTAYQFQVSTTCSATSSSAYSAAASFTTASATCTAPSGLAASAITNTSATLGWTAVSGATGYSVQYKLSSASTWTTVTSATNSYALSGLTAGTAYQFQVSTTCSATSSSAYSAASSFTTSGGTVTYCTSSGTTTYEFLKTTVLGTINHTVANDGGYGNYTSLSTNLTAGTAYTISITPGFASSSYTEYYTVYIDYNQDGVLNGTGETVATGSGTGTGAKTLTFTVPATSKNGTTRLRVQLHYGSASTNPCGVLDYGDVHDYSVNISGGTGFNAAGFTAVPPAAISDCKQQISIFPNPANISATLKYDLRANGLVTVSIVDVSGRKVQSETIGNQNRGSYTYSLRRINSLNNGSYFVILSVDNVVVGRDKLVISK